MSTEISGKTEIKSERWLTPSFPSNGHYKHDAEINWINSLESNLSEKIPVIKSIEEFNHSDNEVAKIRAEIQCATQHCHAAYFENIETLLNNIGKMRRERGVMWCGFGVLGQDDPAKKDQMPSFPEYLRQKREGTLAVLRQWLRNMPLAKDNRMISEEHIEWIYSSLDKRGNIKCWLVGCLCDVLKQSFRRPKPVIINVDLSQYSLHNIFFQSKDLPAISDDVAILKQIERRLSLTDDIRAIRAAMMRLVEADVCHFRFNRWMDNLIVAIGQLKFEGSHAPVEPDISIEGWVNRIRQYIRGINAWIDGKNFQEVINQYEISPLIIRRIYTFLGEASATKIWLSASLSKTMRSIGDDFRPYDEAPPQKFTALMDDIRVSKIVWSA
jgi:hypothetical protein